MLGQDEEAKELTLLSVSLPSKSDGDNRFALQPLADHTLSAAMNLGNKSFSMLFFKKND